MTQYFNASGNKALIEASNLDGTYGGLYGAVLLVIYEDADEPYRLIWLDEGCDTLYNLDGISTDPYRAYAIFNNVTTSNIGTAKITTILPSGNDNTQAEILFKTVLQYTMSRNFIYMNTHITHRL